MIPALTQKSGFNPYVNKPETKIRGVITRIILVIKDTISLLSKSTPLRKV